MLPQGRVQCQQRKGSTTKGLGSKTKASGGKPQQRQHHLRREQGPHQQEDGHHQLPHHKVPILMDLPVQCTAVSAKLRCVLVIRHPFSAPTIERLSSTAALCKKRRVKNRHSAPNPNELPKCRFFTLKLTENHATVRRGRGLPIPFNHRTTGYKNVPSSILGAYGSKRRKEKMAPE